MALDNGDEEVFNLGCGIAVSDFEIFDAIRQSGTFGQEPRYAARRPGEVEHIALDAARAARSLGWKPKVGLGEGRGEDGGAHTAMCFDVGG